jgi:alpha-beta hydrolase superfamily lysophospholipase
MEERVSFMSDGLKLSGVVRVPDGLAPGERRAALLLLHGFGSNKEAEWMKLTAELLAGWGYASMRFDFRGCGDSEGQRARVICLEQVADTSSALTYMASRSDILPDSIGVYGHSFGAAVACYAGGVDKRIAAVMSSGGWGDGEKKFRKQHESPEAWKRFTDMMAEGKRVRAETGRSITVPRFDIVPIPPHLRGNLSAGSHLEFPFEVVESMFEFKANSVVGNIAPRPLLLLHPSNDSVTPTEQSVELFQHAKQPVDLHLIANVDHFLLSEGNPLIINLVKNWLEKYLPARKA